MGACRVLEESGGDRSMPCSTCTLTLLGDSLAVALALASAVCGTLVSASPHRLMTAMSGAASSEIALRTFSQLSQATPLTPTTVNVQEENTEASPPQRYYAKLRDATSRLKRFFEEHIEGEAEAERQISHSMSWSSCTRRFPPRCLTTLLCNVLSSCSSPKGPSYEGG